MVPPDVNHSFVDFGVSKGKILFGLAAIKGCGGSASESIVAEREENGPFRDIFEFCERVESSNCNRSTIETLIKGGAFDSMGAKRSQIHSVLEKAIQAGAARQADLKAGQISLFGDMGAEASGEDDEVMLPDIPEWDERESLAFEKEVLGFYLSSHPLATYEKQLRSFCSHTTTTLKDVKDREEVFMGGMVASVKHSHVKKVRDPGSPTKYVMFDLEDMDGAIRSIQWPKDFAVSGHQIQPDAIVVIRGVLDRRGGDEANLIVNEVIPLEELENRYTSGIKVLLEENNQEGKGLKEVYEIVRGYPGNRDLHLVLRLENGHQVEIKSNRIRVDLKEEMLTRLRQILGNGGIQMILSKPERNKGAGPKYGKRP